MCGKCERGIILIDSITNEEDETIYRVVQTNRSGSGLPISIHAGRNRLYLICYRNPLEESIKEGSVVEYIRELVTIGDVKKPVKVWLATILKVIDEDHDVQCTRKIARSWLERTNGAIPLDKESVEIIKRIS